MMERFLFNKVTIGIWLGILWIPSGLIFGSEPLPSLLSGLSGAVASSVNPPEREFPSSRKPKLGVDEFIAEQYEDKIGVLPYRLFIPSDQNPAKKYPLVLYLHAAGWAQGTNNMDQIQDKTGNLRGEVAVFCQKDNQTRYPCFLVAPQQPDGAIWMCGRFDMASKWAQLTVKMMESLFQSYPSIDPRRVYVVGTSSGGAGALDVLAKFPGKFAGGISIGAGCDGAKFSRETAMPVWIFYGEKDSFTHEAVKALANRLSSLGNKPRVTVYKEMAHKGVSVAYLEPDLVPWLFSQRFYGEPTWLKKDGIK